MSSPDYPGAGAFLPERRTIPALAKALPGCRGCDLYRDATQAVFGEGSREAALVLVGEQPGDVEDREGEPFVGPAGRLLDRALGEVGLARADVWLTNAVKHFRFVQKGKRRMHEGPSRWHVAACEPWLLAELDTVQPQGIVTLGAVAGQSLYGPAFRVGASRGRVLDPPEGRTEWVVATIHPSAVLRGRERREELYAGLVADLRLALDALKVRPAPR
jgi:uracil-DNA glycosylase